MTSNPTSYLPTSLETKITLKPHEINKNLAQNIKRAVEKKYVSQFFSFGYVRPGTIKIPQGGRSLPHKIGFADFTGEMTVDVEFECEVYVPEAEEEIIGRVKSINKLGLLARSENNKMTILMFKDRQTNPELMDDVRINNRIKVVIKSYQIDNQKETIIVIGDLIEVLESVYQNYLLPSPEGQAIEIQGLVEFSGNILDLYFDPLHFLSTRNSRANVDPYEMINFRDLDPKKLRLTEWVGFKNYWPTVKHMIEDYELVHPRGYNRNVGVGIIPFKSEAITRAYFKMWEMLHRYHGIIGNLETDNALTILALGEGPGGFIQAVSHFRRLKYQSPPDTIHGYTYPTELEHLRWEWPLAKKELDKLGQILKLNYTDCCSSKSVRQMLTDLNGQKADLVIADGAIDDPYVSNYKEIANYRLFFGEIVEALVNQKVGGSFVIKVFDLSTQVTAQLLTLLNNYYNEVHITKPNFSRPANSEKYLICLGFQGLDMEEGQTEVLAQEQLLGLMDVLTERLNQSMGADFPTNERFLISLLNYVLGDEDDQFRQKLTEINNDHLARQREHIARGLHMILTGDILDTKKINVLKQDQVQLGIQWCKNYGLDYRGKIDLSDEKLIPSEITNISRTLRFNLTTIGEDYADPYQYFQEQYPHMTFLHMGQLVDSLQEKIDQVYKDPQQAEIFELKTSWATPFSDMPSNSLKWFVTYELCANFPALIPKNLKSPLKVAVFHHFTGEVLKAIHHWTVLEAKRSLDWQAVGVGQIDDLTNTPTNYPLVEKYPTQWLLDQNGDLTDPVTRQTLQDRFSNLSLFWSDLPFYPESEGLYAPHLIGQVWLALMSLASGGNLVLKQFHWFGNQTQSIWGLLLSLFKKVELVKPLASLGESAEFYLVAESYQRPIQKDLNVILMALEELLMTTTANERLFPALEVRNKTYLTPELTAQARYLSYRLVVLNQVPKMQIQWDMWSNSRYSLTDTEKASLGVLLSRRQDIRMRATDELSHKDRQELDQELEEVEDNIRNLFRKVLGEIQEDFSYLGEIANQWLNNHPIRTLADPDQL